MFARRKIHVVLKIFFVVLTVLYAISSCTVLQWRASDTEIQEKFQKLNIPTQISYFEVDSLNLKVRVQEVTREGKRINLVFFHGSPSSLSAWDGYLTHKTLASKANLFAIDRPGYGYSNFGKAMTSITAQAQIMSNLIDAYDLENVIVVGSSYGGPLAARIAVINDRIKAVMMISPAIDPQNEKKIWASRFTQWWTTRWLVPTSYRVAGDEKTVHAEELASIENDWHQIQVPVLHIHGDSDDIVPYENIHFSKANFENINIVTTPETGHEIAWARPELIMPHIMKLIDQLEIEIRSNSSAHH